MQHTAQHAQTQRSATIVAARSSAKPEKGGRNRAAGFRLQRWWSRWISPLIASYAAAPLCHLADPPLCLGCLVSFFIPYQRTHAWNSVCQVVGSGAGGGVAARALASAGMTVLVLEKGSYHPLSTISQCSPPSLKAIVGILIGIIGTIIAIIGTSIAIISTRIVIIGTLIAIISSRL
jgi:hypothetical protein